MFCPKCGAKLPDNTRYCVQCGTELDASPAQPIPKVPPLAEPAKRPQKKIAIAVTAIILVLALLAGGIAVLWNRGQGPAADPYYMSRFTMAEEDEPMFDVTYSQNGRLSEFHFFYGGGLEMVLTPTYDEDGRIQTLTYATESTNTYRFVYEEGSVPGTDTAGSIGVDPTNQTLRLYYDRNNNLVGIVSVQDGASSVELFLDEQGRIKSYSGLGRSAQFVYDSDGNLTDLIATDYVGILSVALDRAELYYADRIPQALTTYLLFSQFQDFTVWLVFISAPGIDMDIYELSLRLQYDSGRLSGGTFTAGADTVTLNPVSKSAEIDSFSASYKGEVTVEFPVSIQYVSDHVSGVDIKIKATENSGSQTLFGPLLLSQRQYDEQGNETKVVTFEPDLSTDENGESVPVFSAWKTWNLREN